VFDSLLKIITKFAPGVVVKLFLSTRTFCIAFWYLYLQHTANKSIL
jgi:hypothetical protein